MGALLLFTAIEMHPRPMELYEPTPRGRPPDVYLWLDSTDPEAIVVEIPAASPTGPATVRDAMRQYNSTYHWHNTVDGVAGWVPPLTLTFRQRMQTFPDDRALAQLHALHVDYVLVHRSEIPATELPAFDARLAGRPELVFDSRFGDVTVYRLE